MDTISGFTKDTAERILRETHEAMQTYPPEYQMFMAEFLLSAATVGKNNDYFYRSYYDLVQQHGTLRRQAIIVPDDPYFETLELGQCYYNAFQASADYGLQYVEGYAMTQTSPFLVPHAWVEEADGTIIDPTWAHLDLPIESQCIYYGVKFAGDFVLERAEATGYCAVLGSDWRDGTPIIKRGLVFKDGIAVALRETS